jgi:hypothetical protein
VGHLPHFLPSYPGDYLDLSSGSCKGVNCSQLPSWSVIGASKLGNDRQMEGAPPGRSNVNDRSDERVSPAIIAHSMRQSTHEARYGSEEPDATGLLMPEAPKTKEPGSAKKLQHKATRTTVRIGQN